MFVEIESESVRIDPVGADLEMTLQEFFDEQDELYTQFEAVTAAA